MKRSQLLNLLQHYQPTAEEVEFKERMLWFIERYPDCFKRTLDVGHITASCWLLNKEKTHALLTHHKKLNAWFQLGGHCDGESDVLAVALKEAREESGIQAIEPLSANIFDIDIHLIPANNVTPAHYHYDVRFLLQVTSDETIVLSEESHSLAWVAKDKNSFPTKQRSVTRLFDKWISR
jgi:8-oxo-dGTP pyrophosphatase MutT (NUDIX family)